MSVRFHEPRCKQKRLRIDTKKWEIHLILYVPIKRFQPGEFAEMDDDEMWVEIIKLARQELLLTGYKILSILSHPILECGRRVKNTPPLYDL